MLKKLQIKFVMINMSIVTIMLIVIFGLVYNFTQRNLETENINMMKAIAANPSPTELPNNSSTELRLPFFTLYLGIDNTIISTSGGYYDLSDQAFLNDLIDTSFQTRNEIDVIEEYHLRYCKVTMPMGTVLVFSDISNEKSTLNNLLHSFAIIGSISFFAFLGISVLLAKWAVKPVAKAWQQQKQFVTDASHELKTPLTVILTNTELLQSPDCTELERTHFLKSISMMSEQMRQLIEKLLLLAKSDTQETSVSMNSLDLSRLVMDSAISFEGIFAEKGLCLESYAEPDIKVHGIESSLQQVIDILLDNAQKYSQPASTTHIVLSTTEFKKCCIKVSNPGVPIPQEELKNIFQRFYRVDKARSRDGSFGLGLSIAENIVHFHKGKIWAESKNGINSFFVELRKCT